jgi:F-type H+-transporting ATPase subunit delta
LSLQTIARRYATALADVAIERGEAREVQSELDQWAEMIEANPQLKEVFANPTIVYDHKRKVLEDLISRSRVRETTASFLRVLLTNQRISQLRDIAARFALVLDERAGMVSATVTTARPIPEDLKSALHDTLTTATWPQSAFELHDRRKDHRRRRRSDRFNHLRWIGSKPS